MNQSWNPESILKLSGAYWQTAVLHASIELDIFTYLKDDTLSSSDISNECGLILRGTEMMLDSLVVLKLLEKKDNNYSNTGFAKKYLVKSSKDYLGYIIKHHSHLVDSWMNLSESLRIKKNSLKEKSCDEKLRENFLMGMFNIANLLAPKISEIINLDSKNYLLDLAGGPGTYAIYFCLKNLKLNCDVIDLATTEKYVKKTTEDFGVSNRINFIAGDINEINIEQKYDVAWLSHILHSESFTSCQKVIQKVYNALKDSGNIYIHDFFLESNKLSPAFAVFFSLNMFLETQDGRSYTVNEIKIMLNDVGFKDISLISLGDETPSRILKATK